jgi:uncharacterized membrane protein YjjB (DUF3815 family)
MHLVGSFIGAAGFGWFFGADLLETLLAGICGIIVGLVNKAMNNLKVNSFFTTLLAAFLMSFFAYSVSAAGFLCSADAAIIGALMILVPGLLFTNAMRDIIYGDTNSGINRIVQVLLIAVAIALGAAAAWNTVALLWTAPLRSVPIDYSLLIECIGCAIGCLGFAIIFNIHGPGILICILGGCVTWIIYNVSRSLGVSEIMAYFWATLFSSAYAEIMARVRKYPAISYLVVAIFPLIPGAGIYYTMNHVVRNDMDAFVQQGLLTIGIAGSMAVAILLGSTVFKIISTYQKQRNAKKSR